MKVKRKTSEEVFNIVLYYWLPFVLWALIIFSFSATTTPAVSQVQWKNFVIKKAIHIAEYAFFTILLFRALKKSGINSGRALVYAFVSASIYGATDEYHQTYTPGRDSRIRDVIIDASGSLLAILIIKILPLAPLRFQKYAVSFGVL